jgi:putative FmdB family regulatory protein
MPSYNYRCTVCESRFEVTRPMSSTSEEHCPKCDAVAKRVFTPVSVAFKGPGFHNTDYRPQPSESAAPAPAPST